MNQEREAGTLELLDMDMDLNFGKIFLRSFERLDMIM